MAKKIDRFRGIMLPTYAPVLENTEEATIWQVIGNPDLWFVELTLKGQEIEFYTKEEGFYHIEMLLEDGGKEEEARADFLIRELDAAIMKEVEYIERDLEVPFEYWEDMEGYERGDYNIEELEPYD